MQRKGWCGLAIWRHCLILCSMTNLLPADGDMRLYDDFLGAQQGARCMAALEAELQWEQPHIKLFGKSHPTPRLVAWAGACDYTYSGHTHKAAPLTPTLQHLWPLVEAKAGAKFNTVLLNLYRSGQDSMGWHADDEAELGQNPTIASLSLGAPRLFKLRHTTKALKLDVVLPSGSLLVMGGAMQHHWQHALPKTAKPLPPRLNLTFRWITPPPAT